MKFFLIVAFALTCFFSDTTFAKEVNLKVKGIGLGSSESNVILKLGKPLKTKTGEFDDCGSGFPKTLIYPKLVIELLSVGRSRNFYVVSIEITSKNWLVSNKIKIGNSRKFVVKTLGKPQATENRDGKKVVFYVNKGNNGFANFIFRRNKLVSVVWASALC